MIRNYETIEFICYLIYDKWRLKKEKRELKNNSNK